MAHHHPTGNLDVRTPRYRYADIGQLWRVYAISVIVLLVMGVLTWLMLLPLFSD